MPQDQVEKSFQWQKSPAHLALLCTFLQPRPPSAHPARTPWEEVLGETPDAAVDRYLEDRALKACSTTETLLTQLPKLKKAELQTLCKQRDLSTSGAKADLASRLTQRLDTSLLLVIPRPYRFLLRCTDL